MIGVLVGRFAPFHNGHLYTLRRACQKYDKVLVLVGSANTAINPKTPWTAQERQAMVMDAGFEHFLPNLEVHTIDDYPLDDLLWAYEARDKIRDIFKEDDLTILGSPKDKHTEHYLDLLASLCGHNRDFVPSAVSSKFPSGTDIRDLLYSGSADAPLLIQSLVPYSIWDKYLSGFNDSLLASKMAVWRNDAKRANEMYRAGWYDPIFVTTDAVVIHKDQLLLVKRGGNQGRGLWALPGGFLEPGLTLLENIKKEIREETGLKIDYFTENHNPLVIDTVGRSLRGRTITHVFKAYSLTDQLDAGDDAVEAQFFPIPELPPSTQWFEDHYHIAMKVISNA